MPIPEKKVNLVERPEWSRYDPAGELGDTIFNFMAELVYAMGEEDLSHLTLDVLSFNQDRPFYISDEQHHAVYEAFRNRNPAIETFWRMVEDSASRAIESEVIPERSQIDFALDKTLNYFEDTWKDWLSGYDIILDINNFLNVDERFAGGFFWRLLLDYVTFEQKTGYYDRYLIFKLKDSSPTKKLLTDPILKGQGGVLDWAPPFDVPKEDIEAELSDFYKSIQEPLISKMFEILGKDMDQKDVTGHADFRKSWKEMFRTDRRTVLAAKKELKSFLRTVKEDVDG